MNLPSSSLTAARNTPTAFANWVFEQNNPRYRRRTGLGRRQVAAGRAAHQWIDEIQRWLSIQRGTEWCLEYADQPNCATLSASAIRIGGAPFQCRPDVVFRNPATGEIVIVERKTHYVTGASGMGWSRQLKKSRLAAHPYPNMWAQAWCYAFVDQWATAPTITLAIELWKYDGDPTRVPAPERFEQPFPEVDLWVRRLFVAYGGSIAGARRCP